MHKNVIITGSNRGIGKAMVEVFAKSGCNVWACARKRNSEFEEYLSTLSSKNDVWVKPVYFEMTDEDSLVSGLQSIFADKLPIDVLVNNAGISTVGLLSQIKVDDIRKLFEVNYFSVLRLIQLVSKKMMLKRKGVIINMASLAGIEAQPGKIAYGSSKAAIILMTKCLAKELGPIGIRVNAIAPGPVETEMIKQYNDDMLSKLVSESSLKRFGKAEEIANTAYFLASDEASYINGEVIKVDGGR
ncbi:MAG: SDR family NAD(P)-dependent oxidoreductase [Candidatus Egerieousia sp.]